MKKILSWLLCFGVLVSCMAPSISKAEESQVTVDKNEVADSMYSDDAFYALNNCDNDLFSYDRGCFTVKQKFMDAFALCITSADRSKVATSEYPSSAYINGNQTDVYSYDSATKTYRCTDTNDVKLTLNSTDFGEYADEMTALNEIVNEYIDSTDLQTRCPWSFTVEDGVTAFPSIRNIFPKSSYVKYVKVPESVTVLSDGAFQYFCIYKLFMESDSITVIPNRCFYVTNVMFSDWSILDGKIQTIGDYAFYQMNNQAQFDGQFKNYKTMFDLKNTYRHTDCSIVLPKFNHVSKMGNVPFSECTLDNTVIDFSGNDVLECGYDANQMISQPSDTYRVELRAASMFYGMKCKQILLTNCSKLSSIGVFAYCDTELLDMTGCNNIYVLYCPSQSVSGGVGTKFNVNGFTNRQGVSNGYLYYSRINEVKLPESCISLQDGAIAYCSIGKINLGNVEFLRGNWLENPSGDRSFHSNVNSDSLFDRTDVFHLKEMDLSGVSYFNSYYDFGRSLYSDFAKEYTDDFVFKAPKNLVWFSPQRNFGGYALQANKDSIGSHILSQLRIAASSGNILLPFCNTTSSTYGFNLVPTKAYASGLSNGQCSWSDVNVSVFARIYKDGIDTFTKSFNQCDSPTDDGKSVFYDQFYYYNDATAVNGFGRALVLNEKTQMSDNYNTAMKTATYRYTQNGTKENTSAYPTLLYLADEFINKISDVDVSKAQLLDLSQKNQLNSTGIKKVLTVYGDFYDGVARELTDYSIKNVSCENDILEFDIVAKNLPKTYPVEDWNLDSESDMFSEGYDFTSRTKHMKVSVKPEISVQVYGDKSVKQGKSKEFGINVTCVGNVPDKSIAWSVAGNTSGDTVISQDGVLTVGLDEIAKELTVTAISVWDNTKTDSLSVKVIPVTTGIMVSGRSILLQHGSAKYAFRATGTVDIPQDVAWSVTGNTDSNTKIDASGKLSLGADETSKLITIKAVYHNNDDTDTYTKDVSICYDILGAEDIRVGNTARYYVPELQDVTTKWTVRNFTSKDTIITDGKLNVSGNESAETVRIVYYNADNPDEMIAKDVAIKQYVDAVHIYGKSFIQKGDSHKYKDVVDGSDNANKAVFWSLQGNVSKDTKIAADGTVFVSEDESAKSVSVCAVSAFDSTKSDVKEVDIVEPKKEESKPNATPTVTASPVPTITPTIEPSITPKPTESSSVKVVRKMKSSVHLKKTINKGSSFEMKLFTAYKANKIVWHHVRGKSCMSRHGNLFKARKKGSAVYVCEMYNKAGRCIYKFHITFVVKNSKVKTLNTSTNLINTTVPCLLFDKDVSIKKGMKLCLPKGVKASYKYSSKKIRVKHNRIYGKKKGYAYVKIILKDKGKRYTYRMHLHFV